MVFLFSVRSNLLMRDLVLVLLHRMDACISISAGSTGSDHLFLLLPGFAPHCGPGAEGDEGTGLGPG